MDSVLIKKDSSYFSHNSNAKDNPKCMLLIDQLGLEGYGIFWVLIEVLREQKDFKCRLDLIPILAKRYCTSSEKMKAVILSFDLFKVEGDSFFYSESLNRRMKIFLEKKKKLSEAGRKGGLARKKNYSEATLKPPLSDAQAIKEKEIKQNTLFESNGDCDLLKSLPPNDGIARNWEGLKRHLNDFKGSIADSNEVIRLSNYGELNHLIWKLLSDIKTSNGKIHSPLAFLLKKLTES